MRLILGGARVFIGDGALAIGNLREDACAPQTLVRQSSLGPTVSLRIQSQILAHSELITGRCEERLQIISSAIHASACDQEL